MAAPTKTTSPPPADRSIDRRSPDGSTSGQATLAGQVFGIEPNEPVMHQVVVAQMAAARAGTHSTLTRAEVRGGGAKPYRQKGTGRARQGSTRAPHWSGGGVAHGPKPRDYSQRTPKKMVRLALRSALSDRASDGKVIVVDAWGMDGPKTKAAKALLDAVGIPDSDRALVVLGRDDAAARRSFANLEGERRVHSIVEDELNAYEVLVADWVVFSQATLDAVTARLAASVSRPSPSGEAHVGAATTADTHEAAPEASDTADEAGDEA